jgi:hypothetical protein
MIKEGNFKGFSVEGIFEYSKAKTKEAQLIDSIKEILLSVK